MGALIRLIEPGERGLPGIADLTDATVLVAEAADGDIAGYVAVTLCLPPAGTSAAPTAHVAAWHVKAPHRRAGIGGALLGAAEAWARTQGCAAIGGEAELTDFVSQRALRRLGFEETGRRVTFRRDLGGSMAA